MQSNLPIFIRFLTVEIVQELHAQAIKRYGGDPSLRDAGLLESATLAPQQTFGGEYLYQSLTEMAAAYWIGLVGNHVFVDGNKRVGFLACDVFLALNDWKLQISVEEAIETTLRIATGQIEREEVVAIVEQNIGPL